MNLPDGRFGGTAQVVRFNWPKYVAAFVVLAAAVASTTVLDAPAVIAVPMVATAGLGAFWTITSLAATWWAYDHHRVYERLSAGLSPVRRWASVHAGFDDATSQLAATIGHPPTAVIELQLHQSTSASLRRARAGQAAAAGALGSRPEHLPVGDGALDTVFLTFAAHEVRDPGAQRALFAELRRALPAGGRLVVTEHLRDLANLAVYGPGAFHFQPARTWHRHAAEAGLVLVDDMPISPFVHRFTWQR